MLIHSIMPHEVIFAENNNELSKHRHIQYNGQVLEVTPVQEGGYKINRIISTSLDSYLDPQLQPGAIIKHNGNIKFLE